MSHWSDVLCVEGWYVGACGVCGCACTQIMTNDRKGTKWICTIGVQGKWLKLCLTHTASKCSLYYQTWVHLAVV